MEEINIIMMSYLGEDMEEDYASAADAVMFYFQEAEPDASKEALIEAKKILQMDEPMQFIRDNNVVWNFDETDDAVREVMELILNAGSA